MIRIDGAGGLGNIISFVYNPLSELSMVLDMLCKPEHHKAHKRWTDSLLSRLKQDEIDRIFHYDELLKGYLNLDENIDYLNAPLKVPDDPSEISDYLRDPAHHLPGLAPEDRAGLTVFLSHFWENHVFPLVGEHRASIIKQMQYGRQLLEAKGHKALFAEINDRVSFTPGGDLKMDKWVESRFPFSALKTFYIELSLFTFPHMLISDRHNEGSFWLSWDVPFRGDPVVAPGIDKISTRAFALSDKSRLRILLMLSGSPMTQKELAAQMGFAKSTVSRHIGILTEAGLIDTGDGERNVKLHLRPSALDDFSRLLKDWLITP